MPHGTEKTKEVFVLDGPAAGCIVSDCPRNESSLELHTVRHSPNLVCVSTTELPCPKDFGAETTQYRILNVAGLSFGVSASEAGKIWTMTAVLNRLIDMIRKGR